MNFDAKRGCKGKIEKKIIINYSLIRKRTFWPISGHFGHFWPRDKSKTIFGNGIPSPIEWAIRFFDRWPFLAQKWPKISQKGHFGPFRPFLA